MAFEPITTELGHSMPPEGPHTISLHAKGWDVALRFRDGDPTLMAKLKSIYPRFCPFNETMMVSTVP
jgi:cystathionine gamma-synthase